jgi:3-oxoacyl-[acyl-carrier protein] reductase
MNETHDELNGKIALVTGGSRGIGRAIALALAEAGADVAINYLSRVEDARRVCAEVEKRGRRGLMVQADVSVLAEVSRMIRAVEQGLGEINILVNNAGIARPRSIAEITEQDWDETMDVNLKSAFLVSQAVLPAMRAKKWGRIINISSVAAQWAGIIGPHYNASKAGMLGLTRSYAAHLAPEGITVNAVAPALIETEMIAGNAQADPGRIPVGRLGTVEEVAEAVVLLVRNGFMTGQTINVNGGLFMI